jgi:hypothetical protein
MCNCITEVEEKLTKLMVEQNPDCEIVKSVTFQNISWVFGKNTLYVLNNPVLGKYRIKGIVKKWKTSLLPSYCPFCGKKRDK